MAGSGLALSLLLAVTADRVLRARACYKTLLDPALCRAPAGGGRVAVRARRTSIGVGRAMRCAVGSPGTPPAPRHHALILIVAAAVWKQISYNFLASSSPGCSKIPKSLIEAPPSTVPGRWRRFWTVQFPAAVADAFFLLVINIVYAFFDTFAIIDAATSGGPGRGHRDPGLQALLRRLQGAGPRRLGSAVGGADGDRHRAHRRAVPLRREAVQLLMTMIEKPPAPTGRCRTSSLILGVLIVAFPVYITFVASTQTAEQIVQHVPMSLLPGGNMLENYRLALLGGVTRVRRSRAGRADDRRSASISALVIAIGKIAISLLSAFAIVYFRFPGRDAGLLADLHHADAAGRGAHPADLPGRGRTWACSTPTPA